MKTILVTGGAGFIGANFIPYFLQQHPDYHVVNLDVLTYAGNPGNLKEMGGNASYTFIKGDICDRILVEDLFDEYDFFGVVHFAAESHVDNSISGPEAFIRTNVFGTFQLLDVARNSSRRHMPTEVRSLRPGATLVPRFRCHQGRTGYA